MEHQEEGNGGQLSSIAMLRVREIAERTDLTGGDCRSRALGALSWSRNR